MKKIILMLFVLGSLLVVMGCQPVQEPEVCEECPTEKALLSMDFVLWGENEANDDEIIFRFRIYNYGLIEAKNVQVSCYAEDENEEIIFKGSKNIGSVGSSSIVLQELYFDNDFGEVSGNIGWCYVSDCNDCVMLEERIPELKEEIERLKILAE